jgi:hypothetical protein
MMSQSEVATAMILFFRKLTRLLRQYVGTHDCKRSALRAAAPGVTFASELPERRSPPIAPFYGRFFAQASTHFHRISTKKLLPTFRSALTMRAD